MSHYDDELVGEPITFGGLMLRANDLRIPPDRSPDCQNVDIERDGSISKRTGYTPLQYNDADDVPYGGEARCDAISRLTDPVGGTSSLYVVKAGSLHRRPLSGGPWVRGYNVLTAGARYSMVHAYGPTGAQALYVANGEDEPIIATEVATGSFWEASLAITAITGGSAGADFVITTASAHGLEDGDIVYLKNITTAPWTLLNNRIFRVRPKDADEFYLLTTSYTVYTVPGSGYSTPLTNEGTADLDFQGMGRWPRGKYDVATGTAGYPERWEDYAGAAGSNWPKGTPDWPAGLCVYSHDVFTRMLAYGFDKDPSRVDYSELGAPWNFLHRDVMAADEASSTNSPYVDGGSFWVHKGDEDRIVHICDMFNYLVVMKTRKIVVFDGYLGVDLGQKYVIHTGAMSARSVVRVGNDIYFWSEDGPRKLSATMEYGDIMTSPSSIDVLPIVRGVTSGQTDKIVGYHDVENQRVIWMFPYNGEADNSAALAYYYTRDQYVFWNGPMCEMTDVVSIRPASGGATQFYGCAAAGGLVSRLHYGLTDDGENIDAYYVTKWFVDSRHRRVTLNFVDIYRGRRGASSTLKLYVGWDYGAQWAPVDSALMRLSGSENGWGSKWGTEFIWGGSSQSAIRFKAEGTGHIVRFKVVDEGSSSFDLVAIHPQMLARGTR